MQQQHDDCKIADALLKRGTKQHADGCDASSKAWAHMVLHLPHAAGGFGVTFNDITKDAAFYTTARFVAWRGAFSQERQGLWLPKDDLKDPSAWSSPPLVLLRDIHDGLLAKYDCKDSAPPPAQPGARARPARDMVHLSRRLLPSLFRALTASMRLICGERTLPRLPSRLRKRLDARFSAGAASPSLAAARSGHR